MLGLKCLLDGVLLQDVANGQVLAPNAILTLYMLQPLKNAALESDILLMASPSSVLSNSAL